METYVCNILCAFSGDKNKFLTARTHGVESFKIIDAQLVPYVCTHIRSSQTHYTFFRSPLCVCCKQPPSQDLLDYEDNMKIRGVSRK